MSRNGQQENNGVCNKLYTVSERLMLFQMNAWPAKINILQMWALTTDHSEKEVEEFIRRLLHCCENFQNNFLIIVMRDFNAKVSKGRAEEHIEPWNLREKNG